MARKSAEDKTHDEDCERRYDKTSECEGLPGCPAVERVEQDHEAQRQQEHFEEIEEILSEFRGRIEGQRGKIRAHVFKPEEHDWAYVGAYPLETFSLDILRDSNGGGKYRLVLLDDHGKMVKGGAQVCLVAEPIKKTEPEKRNESALQDPAVALLLKSMEDQNRQNTELLKAVLSKPAPAQPGLGEMLQVVGALKNMSPEHKGTSLKETLEVLGIAKGLLGDAGDSKSEGGLVSEIVEAVKLMRETGIGRRQAPAQNPPVYAGGMVPTTPIRQAPPIPAAATPTPAPAPATELDKVLRAYIPVFLRKAQRGVNEEQTGIFLYEEICEEVLPILAHSYGVAEDLVMTQLLAAAKEPDAVAKVLSYAPELAPFQSWVAGVISQAVIYAETPEEAPEAPAEAVTQ